MSRCPHQNSSGQEKMEDLQDLTISRQRPDLIRSQSSKKSVATACKIFDDDIVAKGYEAVPEMEINKLPRGGLSVDTTAIGRIQFGLPPETIKDSMQLGISVPSVYIVPVERFCREASPALGINLAEFEFPCYFNYFVRGKRCTLIVDSVDAEMKITQVIQETLMGPEQFRRKVNPVPNDQEDFDPSYAFESRPDFSKEARWFRKQEATKAYDELCIEMLVEFKRFSSPNAGEPHNNLGNPPYPPEEEYPQLKVYMEESHEGRDATGSFIPRRRSTPIFTARRRDSLLSHLKSACIGDLDFSDDSTSSLASLDETHTSWSYSQLKWLGDVCTLYASGKQSQLSARVEIFRMAGGTEYIIHDIDDNNIIIGKACFSGSVQVSDFIEVIGFAPEWKGADTEKQLKNGISKAPTFLPPDFGVTVLGNSHGFDKSGSTSGYVLWINGRGVMIDPPPYSSITLEREGIRPRLIVAILLTHIHADHDGGAFQKILTGSRVSLITTPTVYKSFIRKYSALSGLSPSLLRHSHRHRPAIIGQPLKFHGATFHFTYSFHTIPCIAFRVEWEGKSIIFTGDHMNNPPVIRDLEKSGVLSKARANDLINFPLQDCDLLLHESGAPPIHTQLDVLLALPDHVKARMYIVHTAALPKDCPLKVAPTGTKGTIRLDCIHTKDLSCESSLVAANSIVAPNQKSKTSVLDTWFALNLLSEIPYLSNLHYSATMELLEVAQVDIVAEGDTVVPAELRSAILCVVWEGTCTEKGRKAEDAFDQELDENNTVTIWHAGDWTGPLSIQPDLKMSGESRDLRSPFDIVAISSNGVKVITWDMKDIHAILQSGSPSYRKYLAETKRNGENVERSFSITGGRKQVDVADDEYSMTESTVLSRQGRDTSFLNVLMYNSALSKISAVQKRNLEFLSEGPIRYERDQPIWSVGQKVDYAYLIVSGTAVFRSNPGRKGGAMLRRGSTGNIAESSVAEIIEDTALIGIRDREPQSLQIKEALLNQHLGDKELKVSLNSEYSRLEKYLTDRMNEIEGETCNVDLTSRERRLRESRGRFANIVLRRLYSRRSWTAGLVFSRGHFLSDTSRMMCGSIAFPREEANEVIKDKHSSNLCAGIDGCVVKVFPRKSLIGFLDSQPGLLLSFLGTQVIV